MYDFSCCKLCARPAAVATYRLKSTTVYVCAACDFHYIDHLDDLSTLPREAPAAGAAQSAAYIEGRLAASLAAQQRKLRLVQSCLPLAGAQALDLGAGAGLFAHLLDTAGARVHGIEPQPIFRDFARQRFGLTLQPDTIDAPYWQQGFAGAFDLVTLWDVLEHVNFPAATLRDTCQVLKPGGWLFLDTPRRDAFFYRLSEWSYRLSRGANPLLLESLYSPRPFRHKQLFTLAQLRTCVAALGLQLVRLESPWYTLHSQMTLICRKPLPDA